MRRWVVVPAVVVGALIVGTVALRPRVAEVPVQPSPAPTSPSEPRGWFEGPALDPARWAVTSEGDFKERVADLVESAGAYRLRLRAGTRGTREDTVKYLGVRSVPAVSLEGEARVGVDIDWNRQANGSYLTAALILAPEATDGNPLNGPDWIKVEYVGVPPGKNARMVIAARIAGEERPPWTEGWPEKGREGRAIGVQRVEVVVGKGGGIQVLENGARVYECREEIVRFRSAHVYLQISSRTNYPAREVYFSDLRCSPGIATAAAQIR